MEEILYIAIIIVAIAFALTAIYIAFVLHRVSKLLRSVGITLGELEQEMQQITPELKESLHQTNQMLDDIDDKLKATDSVFDTIDNMGNSVSNVNQAIRKNSDKLTDAEMAEKTKPYIEGIRWSEAATYLYNKWKKRTTNGDKRQGVNTPIAGSNHIRREG
ncbi:DUF948 domain-containing protein [Virgibacillus salexigens]|uniref:DUF948 domain-containing protein n=1 Tax=Virgibacillus kapii TaxID=1638645 RepID=A0ABQ2DZZ0_9BACI|nr:DUF948 domain-containing protein [Virgibacillus kapii]GGJ76804.1 hypothetical protein GCM10007111_43040 [Virgibacillus kapii]